jgi:ribonuclease E
MIADEQARQESLENEQEELEAKREEQRNQRENSKNERKKFEIPEGFSEQDLQDLMRAEELAKQFAYEIMGADYFNEKYGDNNPQPKEEPENEDTDSQDERVVSRSEFYRKYKIQEVIKRNQVVLVQVLKEERGSKGATLSTFLALAGRYCVFMPNTENGGGVSRRISSFSERRRIRDIIKSFELPKGSSIIIRTAGMERAEEDIKNDYNYVVSLWGNIRKQTMESTAPCIIYEESDIVKRSIRDLFKGDISEVIIEGENSFKSAYHFMDLVAPNQKHLLRNYTGKIPIFQKFKIEERLDELYDHEVKLESGGSIVITPTEALVSIDVNSGKATKERSVEDTALKTNIEAAREISRQLRLRDLAGLIVIDFIDMRELRNKKAVERELKDALKKDRAKIQIGRISAFGLLEMSRQRLHSSLVESSSNICPMCRGVGVVRSTDSLVLKALRAIEAESGKKIVSEIYIKAASSIANSLRAKIKEISEIEKVDNVKIIIEEEISMLPNQYAISTEKSYYKPNYDNTRRPNFVHSDNRVNDSRQIGELPNSENNDSSGDNVDITPYLAEVKPSDDNRGNFDRDERYKRNDNYKGKRRNDNRNRNFKDKNRRNDNYRGRDRYDNNQNYEKEKFPKEGDNRDLRENNVTNFDNRNDNLSEGVRNNFPENSNSGEKPTPSKLMGLWKKITG